MAFGSTLSSLAVTAVRLGFFVTSCSTFSPGTGYDHELNPSQLPSLTNPLVCPNHPDLPAFSPKFPSIQLTHRPFRILLQRVSHIAHALGLPALFICRDEAMADGPDEGEVGKEVSCGSGIWEGGYEKGRAGL